MTSSDALLVVSGITERFAGVDIQYRRRQPEWPAPWRATLIANKNERSDYRITVYGETLVDALGKLSAHVWSLDTAPATPADTKP